MRSIMGRARAGYDGISSHSPKRIDLKTLYKVNINENACICPSSNVVSARALENERVMSTAASIATSGVASVDNWRGEYSYIFVHRP